MYGEKGETIEIPGTTGIHVPSYSGNNAVSFAVIEIGCGHPSLKKTQAEDKRELIERYFRDKGYGFDVYAGIAHFSPKQQTPLETLDFVMRFRSLDESIFDGFSEDEISQVCEKANGSGKHLRRLFRTEDAKGLYQFILSKSPNKKEASNVRGFLGERVALKDICSEAPEGILLYPNAVLSLGNSLVRENGKEKYFNGMTEVDLILAFYDASLLYNYLSELSQREYVSMRINGRLKH